MRVSSIAAAAICVVSFSAHFEVLAPPDLKNFRSRRARKSRRLLYSRGERERACASHSR